MRIVFLLSLLAAAAGQIVAPAFGQEEYMSRESSVDEYREALMRSRGIRPSQPTQPRTSSAPSAAARTGAAGAYRPSEQEASVAVPTPSGVSVQIYFAYNSAALTDDAKQVLDRLGGALSAPELAEDSWYIEGHTDASGSADYNQQLSEERAKSVYLYLVREHGIPAERLAPVGKGESELYTPDDPYSNVNRRVRVRHAGG